jgi:hypothetical protein
MDEEHKNKIIEELNAEWDRRLAWLRQPDAREKLLEIMKAQGRTKGPRPKAGPTF